MNKISSSTPTRTHATTAKHGKKESAGLPSDSFQASPRLDIGHLLKKPATAASTTHKSHPHKAAHHAHQGSVTAHAASAAVSYAPAVIPDLFAIERARLADIVDSGGSIPIPQSGFQAAYVDSSGIGYDSYGYNRSGLDCFGNDHYGN